MAGWDANTMQQDPSYLATRILAICDGCQRKGLGPMSESEVERLARLEEGVDGLKQRVDKIETYFNTGRMQSSVTTASALISAAGIIVTLLIVLAKG
jgi:hypothetical protein